TYPRHDANVGGESALDFRVGLAPGDLALQVFVRDLHGGIAGPRVDVQVTLQERAPGTIVAAMNALEATPGYDLATTGLTGAALPVHALAAWKDGGMVLAGDCAVWIAEASGAVRR